ncbi:hypothetical protein HZX00_002875 [Salmonella enterica]|nr:hypothetical protein [Salmonella enterica]EHE6020408.1 hypothetical protein [Salmonella enterica]
MKPSLRNIILYLSAFTTAIFAFHAWSGGHTTPAILLTTLSGVLTLVTLSVK